MSSAIPISSRAGLIGNMSCGNIQEYEVNEGGPSWQGLPVDMNVGMEAVVIGDGAATPEASTDGDYDSSDDEARRRLNKTLVAAPCVRYVLVSCSIMVCVRWCLGVIYCTIFFGCLEKEKYGAHHDQSSRYRPHCPARRSCKVHVCCRILSLVGSHVCNFAREDVSVFASRAKPVV